MELLVPDDLLTIQLEKKITKVEKRKGMIILKEISEGSANPLKNDREIRTKLTDGLFFTQNKINY